MRLRTALRTMAHGAGLYWPIRNWLSRSAARRAYRFWVAAGCPTPPPPKAKQDVLIQYAREYRLRLFVETGTFHGDTVEAMRELFARIISVELDTELHQQNVDRFRGYRHIELIRGDSGQVLERILPLIGEPALFWLDGHYSGVGTARGETDTPVLKELGHILTDSAFCHVVIIDDARCFGTDPAYPSLPSLVEFVRSRKNRVSITVANDSIRILPLLPATL